MCKQSHESAKQKSRKSRKPGKSSGNNSSLLSVQPRTRCNFPPQINNYRMRTHMIILISMILILLDKTTPTTCTTPRTTTSRRAQGKNNRAKQKVPIPEPIKKKPKASSKPSPSPSLKFFKHNRNQIISGSLLLTVLVALLSIRFVAEGGRRRELEEGSLHLFTEMQSDENRVDDDDNGTQLVGLPQRRSAAYKDEAETEEVVFEENDHDDDLDDDKSQ